MRGYWLEQIKDIDISEWIKVKLSEQETKDIQEDVNHILRRLINNEKYHLKHKFSYSGNMKKLDKLQKHLTGALDCLKDSEKDESLEIFLQSHMLSIPTRMGMHKDTIIINRVFDVLESFKHQIEIFKILQKKERCQGGRPSKDMLDNTYIEHVITKLYVVYVVISGDKVKRTSYSDIGNKSKFQEFLGICLNKIEEVNDNPSEDFTKAKTKIINHYNKNSFETEIKKNSKLMDEEMSEKSLN
jgi:hypothetical protein